MTQKIRKAKLIRKMNGKPIPKKATIHRSSGETCFAKDETTRETITK